MELIQQYLDHPNADTILLVVGIVLVTIGFVQVVRKGFALVFWLILFTAGILPLMYVFQGSDSDFLTDATTRVGSLVPGVADDVIKVWCDKLDQVSE